MLEVQNKIIEISIFADELNRILDTIRKSTRIRKQTIRKYPDLSKRG